MNLYSERFGWYFAIYPDVDALFRDIDWSQKETK